MRFFTLVFHQTTSPCPVRQAQKGVRIFKIFKELPLGCLPKLVYKKTCWCKIHQGIKIVLSLIHWAVLTFGIFVTRKFFVNLFLMLVSNTLRSRLPGAFITKDCFEHRGGAYNSL